MNRYSAFLLIFIITLFSCQDAETSDTPDNEHQKEIFMIVDEMPRFPGCEEEENKLNCANKKFLEYLYSSLQLKTYDQLDLPESTLLINFVIELNGDASHIKIAKGKEVAERSNIVQLITDMPYWIPGKLRDTIRRVQYRLPLKLHYQ